jgi:hypothetical protein
MFIIILLIFLYKNTIEGQSYKREEGFSSAERDIRASFNMMGVIKRDKSGKICKIGERNKETEEAKPIILEKETDENINPPMNTMMIQDKLNSSVKETKNALSEITGKQRDDIISKIKIAMQTNDIEELKEIKNLTNKIDLLHLELKHSKDKEKIMDKLIDKIHVDSGGPIFKKQVKKNNNHILLFVVLFILFSVGGVVIVYILKESNDGPISYRDAVIKAKQNLLRRGF